MTHREKEECLRDVDARQRNIVFPDTVTNEARFWRNLYESKGRLTIIQRVGLVVMAFLVAVMVIVVSFVWQIGIFEWIFGGTVLGAFLLIVKWGTRRLGRSR